MTFSRGRSRSDYAKHGMLRSAIERQLITIGEACSQLRSRAPEVSASIPDIAEIIGFRHVLVHGYVQQEIPPSLALLGRLLDDAERG